ncbi:MAG: histidine kinase [Deltaproteobacteria bacterium]|nr:histidine kinase [Deltaproteobacteria bacterium]
MPFDRYLAALRGLADPRRLAALTIVLVALLGTELLASRSMTAVGCDAVLFVVFVLVAPGSYRALSPAGGVGLALYGTLGVACIAGVALVVAHVSPRWTYIIDPGSLLVLAVLFLVGGWGFGRDVDLTERAEALALETQRARLAADRAAIGADRATLIAEQNALLAQRAQLDPHFLFNVLNAIAELTRHDPARAEEATLALASMLRSMLDATHAPTWPVSKELALLRTVTELYAMRDRDKYRFSLAWPALDDVEVPPLLLLPIIENAITHGPASDHEGEVSVVVARGQGSIDIVVENPGAFAGRREGGQGLAMIDKRLALAFGEGARFTIEARGSRTLATVSLPTSGTTRPA